MNNPTDDNVKLFAEIASLFLFLAMIVSCLCSGYVGVMYGIGEIEAERFGPVNWLDAVVGVICLLSPLIIIALAGLGLRFFFVRKQTSLPTDNVANIPQSYKRQPGIK